VLNSPDVDKAGIEPAIVPYFFSCRLLY